MSQGKQSLPSKEWNVIINTSKLNDININLETKIATVGSGATWSDLQRVANEHGLAVCVTIRPLDTFSIGGSLSANCHGWDYKSGSLEKSGLIQPLL